MSKSKEILEKLGSEELGKYADDIANAKKRTNHRTEGQYHQILADHFETTPDQIKLHSSESIRDKVVMRARRMRDTDRVVDTHKRIMSLTKIGK